MKIRSLFFTIALLFATLANAQSFKFGTITADAGVGFGIYGIKAYSPINKEEHSGIGFVGTLPAINAEFGLARFVGVGVRYRRGTYGKSGDNKLRGNDLLVRVSFHLANKNEKFDLPIGIGYGTSSFGGDISATEYLRTKGSVLNIHVSPHLYFGKYVGMFLSVGYNKHMLNRNIEMKDSSGKVWTNADGATWNMGGVYFEFGIAGRFDMFNKKDKE
ncbi:hypothetical protein BH10BAC1_BH10BAC1_00890 [soil metagenome]